MQMAYVPADFQASLRFWTGTMGVGPFFLRPHFGYDKLLYRGTPSSVDFSIAVAYWGDMQIELIEQHNSAASIYSSWRNGGHHGVHHFCILVDDIGIARAICAEDGFEIVQEIYLPAAEVIYVDAGGGSGTLLEIIQIGAAGKEGFARMRDAARDWDGSDPVRVVG